MSLQGPSSSDSQSRDLIPKALGPGLRSGQGGPALAKELSNQATSLSNAMLLKLRPKKIKYQNFEGSVSMQMFSFGLRLQNRFPSTGRDSAKHPGCSVHSRPRCCHDITVKAKAQGVWSVSTLTGQRRSASFLSFWNHRKQEGGLLNLDCTLEFITPAAFIPAAQITPYSNYIRFSGIGARLQYL